MTANLALLNAHIAVFFMGIAGVLAVASGFDAWLAAGYRVSFGAVILGLYWLVFAKDRRLPPWPIALGAFAMGAVLGVHWFAFFHGMKLLGVMLGSASIGLEPLIVALAARLVLKERLQTKTLWAMGFSLIGFALLAMAGNWEREHLWLGFAWMVFSYLLFAVLVLCNRVWVQKESPVLITTLEMAGAIPVTLLFCSSPWWPQTPVAWAYALGLGLLCTGLAYALYNASMQVLAAPTVGLLLSLEVVYGMIGGWVIGDSLTSAELAAAVSISSILVIDIGLFLRRRYVQRLEARNTPPR
ncbi:DMT family transporter [Acanthopleuribacter pedis]|uniref:DMT family transporter n=1 Tax=Acanthopleuribacter pedis TaxID=442870 RepID=A0A8J7QEN7_9BACT|nr:DMT family transporter [Acanthopleuribacter pedis]MBO1316975.1 DMT family transporter [Acanthopleuribacter pedis]